MLASTASLIDSLSAMTEIFSKAGRGHRLVLWSCVGSLSSLSRKQLLMRLETCSQFFSFHLTRSVKLEKIYFLLWIWRLLICCWEVYVSLYLSMSWRLATSLFFQLFLKSFLRFHRRLRLSPPLLWYLLRDFTPSIGPWSTEHFQREHTDFLFGRRGYWLSLFPRYVFCHS